MLQHPFSHSLDQINFDSAEDCRKILLSDKHTRVEGLCSEAVFGEDIVEGNISTVAPDFWFSVDRRGKYDVLKIVTNYEKPLSELELRILDQLAVANKTGKVGIVHFDDSTNTFRAFGHVKGESFGSLTGRGNVWPLSGRGKMAEEEDRDEERILKACDFLEERGMLKDAAIKRIFANCVLGRDAVWDVDVLTLVGNIVVALEVKHKYPTADGCFGVNIGQERFFEYLIGADIPVIHVILEKPVRRKDFSAIDLLTMPEYVGKARWRYLRLLPEKFLAAIRMAPEATAIYGHTKLPFRAIPEKRFGILKGLGKKQNGIREKLFEGIK